jgi:hypothetical protein
MTESWVAFSDLYIMNPKVQLEASLNGITKNIHPHRGSVSGKHRKLNKGSWDSGIPFPSKYFFFNLKCYVNLVRFGLKYSFQKLVKR